MARIAGFGALIVAIVLVAMVLFGGDEGNKYKLLFETGGQLVPGNQVLVGGQPIGTVDDITLTDDCAGRRSTITVDEPLHEGTTAVDPRDLALGGRQPLRLDLPGPELRSPRSPTARRSRPTRPPRRSTSTSSSTPSTRRPRRRCSNFIQGQRRRLHRQQRRRRTGTYKYFAPGLQATPAPVRRADPRPGGASSQFLVTGSKVVRARSPSAATTSPR